MNAGPAILSDPGHTKDTIEGNGGMGRHSVCYLLCQPARHRRLRKTRSMSVEKSGRLRLLSAFSGGQ